jgi:hypothetical protein
MLLEVSNKRATWILVFSEVFGFSVPVLFIGFALEELQLAKEIVVAKSAKINSVDFMIFRF